MNAAKKKIVRSVRFHAETHGEELLAAVREFERMRGVQIGVRKFWKIFKDWADRHATLKRWSAPASCWRSRYRLCLAKEKAQIQIVQAREMQLALRAADIQMEDAYRLIAQQVKLSCNRVKRQFWGVDPWSEDVADALVKLIGKDPRDMGVAPTLEPTMGSIASSASAQIPLYAASLFRSDATSKWRFDPARSIEVIEQMERLADAGLDMDNASMRAFVEGARVRESAADVAASILRGRKVTAGK